MINPENDLKNFFTELRAEDQRVAPPPFTGLPKRKSGRKIWHLAAPLGAAASILLLFLVYPTPSETTATSSPADVLVISLETRQESGTESLLTSPDPVFNWESPSASLISDF